MRALPEGSVVVFRPSTMWEDHWILILMVIAVILVQGLLIAALFRSTQRRRTMTRELHRLSGRLITAQEDERRRVARELHDDISQRLALLAIELDSTIQGVGFDNEPLSSKVNALARDVHAIAHNLHPSRLDSLGLAPALGSFCEEIEQRHGVRVLFRGPEEAPGEIPAEPALAIYRVAQEALQNAIRHSGASEISMTLTVKPPSASLAVSDNGIGIAENDPGWDHGLGIIGMRERVRLVGGTFDVQTDAGVGTVINIQAPIGNSREE
jgi:signal transduction histidine kinase